MAKTQDELRKDAARRRREATERKRQAGLYQTTVWIKPENEHILRKAERALQDRLDSSKSLAAKLIV